MIKCTKIATYELRPKNLDVFNYLKCLGLQQINPPSLAPRSIQVVTNRVYCSQLNRALECISPSDNCMVIATKALNEIIFDIESLCSRTEYENFKSQIVRKRLREAFITDSLGEPRSKIFDDVKNILKEISKLNEATTIVSHSFKLKVLEAYVRSIGAIERNPELINDYVFDDQKTFDFGAGFTISDQELKVLQSILTD